MQILIDQHQKETKKHGSSEFPFLISHERLSAYESGSFLWHWHPELELTWICSGSMEYRVNGLTFHLKGGDALLVNSGCLHSAAMLEQQDCVYSPVTFDAKLIYGSESNLLYTRFFLPILQNPLLPAIHFDHSESWHEEIILLTHALLDTEYSDSPDKELDIQILLLKFWKLLYAHTGQSIQAPPIGEDRNYIRIRRVLDYIEQNYASLLNLDDISSELSLSKGECCRLFRRCMNLSIFEFLQQYRIEKSIPLLADPDYSITEISGMTGFSDPNYFAKVFRKQKSCSPSAYRRQLLHSD